MTDPTVQQLVDDPSQLNRMPAPLALTQGGGAVVVPAYGDHVAEELGAAVLITTLLVRHRLQGQPAPAPGKTHLTVRGVWADIEPTWLRLARPAILEAYRLGKIEGLTPAELENVATAYAQDLGGYLHDTSTEALTGAMDAQLSGHWSADVAWHRASYAYGLDRQQMKSYLRSVLGSGDQRPGSPIPLIARTFVDKATLARAERVGRDQSYSARESGKAMAWMYLERQGRLPSTYRRRWALDGEDHCAVCTELHQQDAPLDEPFTLSDGTKLWSPRAHPGCTCKIYLIQPRTTVLKSMPTVAGMALLARSTGRVLMIQRASDPKDPAGGMWEFPGGHLDRGETPLDAAKREWQEEVRRLFPGAAPVSSWRHGIYQGFVALVDDESAVPTHTRGRIRNPDDPDGDEIEAIAWWDPAHLGGNKAVRTELRASLRDVRNAIRETRIGKAYDPKEQRSSNGRWAKVATKEAERVEQPVLPPAEKSRPFGASPSPFTGAPSAFAASPFTSSPFSAPETRDPFANAGTSLFRAPGRADRIHRSTKRHIMLLPKPESKPPADQTFYLSVPHMNEAMGRARDTGYDVGQDFDFTAHPMEATSTPVPWTLLADSDYSAGYASSHLDREEIEDAWRPLVEQAAVVHGEALSRADSLIPTLQQSDLNRIFKLAGEPTKDPGMQRHLLARSVHHRDEGDDDSLAHAYADYVTWQQPELVGEAGKEMRTRIDEAEPGLSLYDASYGHPVQQVLAFETGMMHPATAVQKDTAFVRGGHVTHYHRYRSALADLAYVGYPPPLRIGMRETVVGGFEPNDKPPRGS